MIKSKIYVGFMCIVLLSACDKTVTENVQESKPVDLVTGPDQGSSPSDPSPSPGTSKEEEGAGGFKFSAGQVRSTSADMNLVLSVSMTNQTFDSGDMKATISLGRTRVISE